jgi:ABC-type phosphate transport system substrate-binding protein
VRNSQTPMSPWSLRLGAIALPVLSALVCCVFLVPRSNAAEPFMVIVNAANPVSAMSADELSKAFMKRVSRWPDGVEVAPVDLKEQSEVRDGFSRAIHGKSASAVKAYWQKMIFSGRDVPPPEKANSAEVVAFIRANRGAVGYVAADTALGSGVKAIRLTP